jgi:hypothetical protein
MESHTLRFLIREKLGDDRLPHNGIPHVWGGPGNGESCDACEETIPKSQMIIEGAGADGRGVQFHVMCFYVWDAERKVTGRESSEPDSRV